MTDLRLAGRWLLGIWMCCCLNGCFPVSENPIDEQKDPHFLAGKARLNSLDYKGAIECFEKALEANPRSASAHFELGVLYEQKENDYPAAIYHYDKHLQLRPNSDLAEIVRQHVAACKLEIAKGVSFGVVTREVQRDLDRLTAENATLRQQIESYKTQLAQRSWPATNTPPAEAQNPASNAPVQIGAVSKPIPSKPESKLAATTADKPAPTVSAAAPRAHVIKAGDTPMAIARKYGISLSALRTANPGLDARKLRVGQVLRIPGPKN